MKAVKESNGDEFHRMAVIKHIRHKINVFSGAEPWLLHDVVHGGNSMVSICNLGAPKAALACYKACMMKDFSVAVPLNRAFFDVDAIAPTATSAHG